MKKITIIIIVLFTSIFISAQNINSDDKLLAFKNSIEQESIGHYSDAISDILKITDKYKSDYLVNLRLGWLYYLNKDYTNSITFYKKAIQSGGENNIEAMLGITLPLSGNGDWDGVKEYYKKVIDIDEHNYTANLRLGQILLNTENYLNAKVYLSKVHEHYPGDYESNLYLAWTLYYLGDKSTAKELFTKVLLLNPGDESALVGMKLVK